MKMSLAEYVKKMSFGGEVKSHDPKRFGLPKAEIVKLVQTAQSERNASTSAIVAAAAARGLTVNRRYNDDRCWDWSSPFKPGWLLFANSDDEALKVLQSGELRMQVNLVVTTTYGGYFSPSTNMDFRDVKFSGSLTQEVYDSLVKSALQQLGKDQTGRLATPKEVQAFYDSVDEWWKNEGRFECELEDKGLAKSYHHACDTADQFGEERPTAAKFLSENS